MKHPHAEIFIALANGTATINDIEIHHQSWKDGKWLHTIGYVSWMSLHSAKEWQVRIKQKTIMFNGVELPEPLIEEPKEDMIVYIPDPIHNAPVVIKYSSLLTPKLWLKKGLLHASNENAIAWTKAMIPFKQEDY